MSAPLPVEHVGIVLVHGIGEQRRFEHLDNQLRALVRSLRANAPGPVSVEVVSSAGAAFGAEQESWASGPGSSVVVTVRHSRDGKALETRLHVHEVWWADVNEPYSLAKQIRFWLWGLAVWTHPGQRRTSLATADEVIPPNVDEAQPGCFRTWVRLRLFLTGCFFVLLGGSLGLLSFLASRLFQWQPPRLLRIVTNYVSGVKLYTQRRRLGPGIPGEPTELIDSIGQPPRVSVRRRMVRTLADVACLSAETEGPKTRYDRWYVLAHSLGSVVAFNGLMDTGYAWPGYLDQARWKALVDAGMTESRIPRPIPSGNVRPDRPAWLDPAQQVNRAKVFERFRGLLTYGSPLEKFATIWPALVPLSRRPAFPEAARWINVFDPLDPVSGQLRSFAPPPDANPAGAPAHLPEPRNLFAATHPLLLLGHIKYFAHPEEKGSLAAGIVNWLLTGSADALLRNPAFRPGKECLFLRTAAAWLTWFAFALVLALIASVLLPWIWGMLAGWVEHLISADPAADARPEDLLDETSSPWWPRVLNGAHETIRRVPLVLFVAAILTFLFGLLGKGRFKRDEHDPEAAAPEKNRHEASRAGRSGNR